MMALATQAVMQSLSMQQIGGLASCIENYLGPNHAVLQNQPNPADIAAQMAWAQDFMQSPDGQGAIAHCQGQIQTLLPLVQQQMNPQNSTK